MFHVASLLITIPNHRRGTTADTRITQSDPSFLRKIIPFLLLGIAGWLWLKPEFGAETRAPRMRAGVFAIAAGVPLGFYDGFFGPGVGSFWMSRWFGLPGIWIVYAADEWLRGLLLLARWVGRGWLGHARSTQRRVRAAP